MTERTPGQVELLLEGRPRDVGSFQVRRLLPAPRRRLVGPFIFFDEMGPVRFAPGQGMEVRAHPHIGLATVTYLLEGRIVHRDSLGVVQTITPGALNLMTAGHGISHSERSDPDDRAAGHGLHGIQTWLALPRDAEDGPPDFVHHPAQELPLREVDGPTVRLIAGAAFGATSPVAMPWPTLYADISLPAGAGLELPADVEERAVYVVAGAVALGDTPVPRGSMAVLAPGAARLTGTEAARVMLIGGQPMDGPREIWWNLVASDRARIEQAKADWTASAAQGWTGSRFTLPPGESAHIPLPGS